MDSGFEDQTIQPTGQTQTISSCILGAPMTLENPRWYGFIAGSQVIDFDIKLLGPTANGTGLEAAIISGCGAPPFKAISCANLGTTGGTLTAFLLTVGQPYLLVIDGINGDIGKYRVDVSFGTTKAPPMGSPGAITGPTHVCPGAVLNYSIAPVANAFTYTWTAPPGSKINGAGNTVVIPANGGDNGTSVSVQFGQVSGVLCVTASNPCSVPQNSCIFQITNEPLPINDLPEVTVCNEELPYIWDQAQSTINGLMNAVNTLDYYKTQLGSLDSYIGKFQDVNYYKNSPCFTAAGCSDAERAALRNVAQLASESQKKANDALFKGLDRQQTNLTADAATLQRLQSAAQGAQGQMQAIGYANQLASQQANQLLRYSPKDFAVSALPQSRPPTQRHCSRPSAP